jgi:hypothetical protein
LDNQSNPSYKPSPLVAQVDCTYHVWCNFCNPSLSET